MIYKKVSDNNFSPAFLIQKDSISLTVHNLTPEKRDNNYSPHPLTPLRASETTFNLKLASSPVVSVCNAHFKTLQYYAK